MTTLDSHRRTPVTSTLLEKLNGVWHERANQIFMVIVLDAFFAVFFTEVGWG